MHSLSFTSVQRLTVQLPGKAQASTRELLVRPAALSRRHTLQASLGLSSLSMAAAQAHTDSTQIAVVGTGTFARTAWSPLLKCAFQGSLPTHFGPCHISIVHCAQKMRHALRRICIDVEVVLHLMQELRGRVRCAVCVESIRELGHQVFRRAARRHVRCQTCTSAVSSKDRCIGLNACTCRDEVTG